MQDLRHEISAMQRGLCHGLIRSGLQRGLQLASLLAMGAFAVHASAAEFKLANRRTGWHGLDAGDARRSGADRATNRRPGSVQVLSGGRHGQRRPGTAQDARRADSRRRVRGFGDARPLQCDQPVRGAVADSVARRNRLCPRAHGSGLARGPGRLRIHLVRVHRRRFLVHDGQ